MDNSCQYCKQCFTRRDNLLRHLKGKRCRLLKIEPTDLPLLTQMMQSQSQNKKKIVLKNKSEENLETSTLRSQMKELEEQFRKQMEQTNQEIFKFKKQTEETNQEISKLKKKPSNVINNNLQIVCVGDKDNYLDMLTEEYGNFSQALEYIKDCALSNLSGDCKLIERIYLNNSEQKAIRYTDKNRTKVEYFNENEEKVIDTKEVFGRKIANNLQNSYLKGVNHLINENLENRRCPNKFLEEYDLQMWNQHIYSLSDLKYQKKIMNQLEIPIN